jgi:hypothetical protein
MNNIFRILTINPGSTSTKIAVFNNEEYVVEGLPETVDITMIGSRANLYLAKQLSSQAVTVDLSDLKVGTHQVNLKYKQAISNVEYKLDPSTVNINIYPKVSATKTAIIDTINKETLDTKLSVSKVAIDKTEIIIKGAEHIIKEVANVILLMRKVLPEELDKESRMYMKPYRLIKDFETGKWSKTYLEDLDASKDYRLIFIDKNREGEDSKVLLYEFSGRSGTFTEIGMTDNVFKGQLSY